VRPFALALQTRDTNPDNADEMFAEAIELEDRATAIETAGKPHEQ